MATTMNDDLQQVLADLDHLLVRASRRVDATKDPDLWGILDMVRVRLQRVGLLLFVQHNQFSRGERELPITPEPHDRP